MEQNSFVMGYFVYILKNIKDGSYYVGLPRTFHLGLSATTRADLNTLKLNDHGRWYILKNMKIDPVLLNVKTT